MPSPAPVLALDHVAAVLAGRRVVSDVSLRLDRGDVLGLLGVNGAGKSTTLRMIAGVLAPAQGTVALDGEDIQEKPEAARRGIGYLPETPPLHAELTVAEYLSFCARLHGVAPAPAVERAIERCDLGDVRHRLIGALSKGFRQRVGLAQAILHSPKLIVLDEPASGLDPVQANNLRALIRGLRADHAVILSTHVLPDVVACCDRVAILHEGVLRHEGRLDAESDAALRIIAAAPIDAAMLRDARIVASAAPIDGDARRWRVRLRDGVAPSVLAKWLVERGVAIEEIRRDASSLDDTFMAIAAGADVVAA
jgi:ABC-2 type transport system ATP-binding protein